ncbi:MAG: hypothetical protein Q8S33_22335 [Myxococcales bacterium]|nr:hypothetical protein [Myxococcales bacterium]MDP3503087.1 hypothetical protein [Myxococcales bacterium]
MKRLFVVLLVTLSSMVMAQEIGTEITPVTPENKPNPVNQPNDNPYATQPANPENPKAGAPVAAVDAGGARSAGKGAFGIRATFAGQPIPVFTIGPNTTPPETGSVGLAYWGSDNLAVLFDLGFGLGISGGGARVGFAAGVGIDYHFRTTADALRPLINVQVAIASAIANDIGNALQLSGQFGGGAAYFFSPHFSLTGRISLGLRIPFASGLVTLTTFTPAVGAAWYF